MRASCEPFVRNVARVAVRVVAYDGECTTTLTAHVIIAAATGAAFSIGAAFAGVGSSELCKIAGAVVVGALAVSAATVLIRRQLDSGGARPSLRPLLASAARQVISGHAQHPAARILRVVYGHHPSLAVATVGLAVAVLAPALPSLPSLSEPGNAQLLRFALKPAKRLVPGMGIALDVHGAYRHSRDSARFVREFALAAASLCPAPRELPLLVA
ncbi:MAG TPA: hypothetical protein VMG12_45550 [Polyangiaceae bacterium]|nr:hypothetical protein [Polyangiaceae bacterium]